MNTYQDDINDKKYLLYRQFLVLGKALNTVKSYMIQLTSWLVELFYFLYIVLDQSYIISTDVNNFCNFRALFIKSTYWTKSSLVSLQAKML